MIKVINQEEFEKCLPMLDSPDVECRLLGGSYYASVPIYIEIVY